MPVTKAIALRGAVCAVAVASLSCQAKAFEVNWTCDFDASEGRPLGDPDAAVDDAGVLSPGDCMTTCGPPVISCKRILLDASLAGALCPVCTF
jgi:hypothetical protein